MGDRGPGATKPPQVETPPRPTGRPRLKSPLAIVKRARREATGAIDFLAETYKNEDADMRLRVRAALGILEFATREPAGVDPAKKQAAEEWRISWKDADYRVPTG